MAQKVRIEMQSEGFKQLLNSQPVADEITRRAQNIADAAGPGHVVYRNRTDRATARVVTADFDARLSEARDKTLTRAIDAGRN